MPWNKVRHRQSPQTNPVRCHQTMASHLRTERHLCVLLRVVRMNADERRILEEVRQLW